MQMQKRQYSIVDSMIPSQRQSIQSIPNPKEFSPTDWMFNPYVGKYNWQNGVAVSGSDNFFDMREPYKFAKTATMNPLTGREPTYGHIDYSINPLNDESANAKLSGYQIQKETRIHQNMNPNYYSIHPAEKYPVKKPYLTFVGSRY